MIIKEVRGKKPAIPADCYIAENATIVGDVSFGEKPTITTDIKESNLFWEVLLI